MTNKEAVIILKNIQYDIMPHDELSGQRTEDVAFSLAIKALEQIDLIKFNIYALNKLIEEAENDAKRT